MPPALQSFDSADVQGIDELQACLLVGWENHLLTCGSEISMIRGILWTPHRMDLKIQVVLSSLRSKQLPRGQSLHPQHGFTLPVGPTEESWQYQALTLCMGRGCSSQFHPRGVSVLEGSTAAKLVRLQWLALHKDTAGQHQARAQQSANQILKYLELKLYQLICRALALSHIRH